MRFHAFLSHVLLMVCHDVIPNKRNLVMRFNDISKFINKFLAIDLPIGPHSKDTI